MGLNLASQASSTGIRCSHDLLQTALSPAGVLQSSSLVGPRLRIDLLAPRSTLATVPQQWHNSAAGSGGGRDWRGRCDLWSAAMQRIRRQPPPQQQSIILAGNPAAAAAATAAAAAAAAAAVAADAVAVAAAAAVAAAGAAIGGCARMLHAGTIDFCTVIGPVGQIRATAHDRSPFGCAPLKARHPSFLPFPSKSSQACSSAISNFTVIGLAAKGQLQITCIAHFFL